MYDMLEKYQFDKNDFKILSDYAKSKKIIFCSTPFDKKSCDLLENLAIPFYKIGSGDLDNIPLINHVAKLRKPIFLSTGMSTMSEISESLKIISKYTNKVVLMHCTSVYPADFSEANLNLIKTLENNFNLPIGYSDHTVGFVASLGSIPLGACVIEKHLTLSKSLPGPDHKASMNPTEFKLLVKHIRNLEKSFGLQKKKVLSREKITRNKSRRSIISIKNITRNTVISKTHIDILRPANGISPRFFDKVLGMKAKRDIPSGTKLTWNMLK